jgi:serine/threonine protein kinase
MLDNFAMGDPISEHNGVRCCPAIQNNSDNKYIVKIISTPASQTQLDALLLSGAYSSVESADNYFKTLAEDVINEVSILEKLSQLEGFLPYTDTQLVPMDDGTGYDVYLLSPYRKTLEQLLRRDSMTHLAALNLALDICAALTICRRSGYLYVDLKPENIYFDQNMSCKIGDIGFLSLDSLRYSSLPERYRSAYTAPEINDAFAAINTTVDVYALGLILYQVFNDGILPNDHSGDPFAPPAYADYEMAEIILKACNPDPTNRWQDPVEMGQAIVGYMQRNGAHDKPIVPVIEPEPVPDSTTVEPEDETPETIEEITESKCASESNADSSEENPANDVASDAIIEAAEEDITNAQSIEILSPTEENLTDCDNDIAPSENNKECQTEDNTDSQDHDISTPTYIEDSDGNLSFLSAVYDETTPEESGDAIDYAEVSNEVSDILQQVDELISHPAPEPAVAPDPIDVPIPPPLPIEVDTNDPLENSTSEAPSDNDDLTASETADENTVVNNIEDIIAPSNDEAVPKKRHWLRDILVTVTVLAIAAVGVLFYTRYYLQPIDSIILQEHDNGDLTVLISSPVDNSKLTVICADTYGNQLTRPVINNQATFTGLAPDSAYTVKIAIDGFHKLTGDTSAAFTTPEQTNILQFKAVTGSEDGSVILTFTIDGPDSPQWVIRYSAEGIEENSVTFSGRMCTITGLTIGQAYKFALTPATNINYTGTTEVTHTASAIVKAENLRIVGCLNGALGAVWTAPENSNVNSWTVRCYNESGYDKTITVSETKAIFEGVDNAFAYTVEVTADGMSISERAYAAENSITVTDFTADISKANNISLSWNGNGYPAENGWLVMYTVDGSATQEIADIKAESAVIKNKIPCSKYVITLQTPDGRSILGGQIEIQTPDAKSFSGYGVSAKYMEFKMCKRPSNKNWDRYDLSSSDYTSTFSAGEKASFLVRLKREYNTSKDNITTLYVIRNENGIVVNTSSKTTTWTKMWYRSYCELDIPAIPQSAGKYTISVYFNGALAHKQNFKVTA